MEIIIYNIMTIISMLFDVVKFEVQLHNTCTMYSAYDDESDILCKLN